MSLRSSSPARLSRTAKILVGAYTVNGVLHIVKPEMFEPLMPDWVPAHREVNIAVGVVELATAAGLSLPATRRAAGLLSTAVVAGVFPGNVQMAIGAMAGDNRAYQAAALARLPLQWPMLTASWRAFRAR
ncbi:DoxX family protein [Nocardioides acrostichi]|uniref:DoxX family protein n=1 Tax=Nocardioides acrostichi TaxID=2784339 RepID=A0A930UYS9_9ACTN|nr:hypothetical protein [Nocardioides acrostichi]MBF4160500.1 hypothetical protein [Nocardioides acrostichi]